MKMLDLFSGIGGFSLAGKLAGFETVGFSEIEPFCCKVLSKNFPTIKNYGDIKSLNWTDPVTLITGGFPCQPFSVAGKKRGKNDKRYLWPEFFRIISSCRPNWIIAENVTGIISVGIKDIIADLESKSYSVRLFVLPACAANAPHRRDRLWIVANRDVKRCNERGNNWEKRYLQENFIGDISAIQSEWEKFKPISWEAMQASEWLGANADFMRIDDGLPSRVDRIKALGNAIIPQIVYPIMKMIYLLEQQK